MFAQKTTELLRRIRRFQSIGKRVLVVKKLGDNRYSDNAISSHDGESCLAKTVDRLAELDEEVSSGSIDVVVIDEGQFFEDLVDRVVEWTDRCPHPIHVIVAGLDGDTERQPFGKLLELVCYAEEVLRLSAYCKMCGDGTEAHFTKWIGERQKGDQVTVGGAEAYAPVCRQHWLSCD